MQTGSLSLQRGSVVLKLHPQRATKTTVVSQVVIHKHFMSERSSFISIRVKEAGQGKCVFVSIRMNTSNVRYDGRRSVIEMYTGLVSFWFA